MRADGGMRPDGKGRVLVTGANGLLGRELCDLFSTEYETRATDETECDVTRPEDCRVAVGNFRPDIVLHCAAYTAVDRAEAEEAKAMAVNRDGTRNVARACRASGALLVTFGSDYVFDGSASRPYAEDDPVRPLSAYGRSKLAAEEALREEAPNHLLIRSQWLYGAHGPNFVFAVLRKARNGEPIRVVSDQKGCPTHARDLAAAVKRLLEVGGRGTFHFSNEGEATWHEFASFFLSRAFPGSGPPAPARTADLGYPAPRPAYSALSKEKYRRATGESPRRWEDAALEFLTSIHEGGIAW